MNEINISITESGERLYVTPYTVIDYGSSDNNRVHFYHSDEFEPYDSFELRTNLQMFMIMKSLASEKTWIVRKLKKIFGWKIVSRAVEHYNVFKYITIPYWMEWVTCIAKNCKLHGLKCGLWYVRYVKITPFISSKFPGIRLGLRNQLYVNDPNMYSDTSYLTPSQKYIRMRLDQYADEVLKSGIDHSKGVYEHTYEDVLQYVQMRDTLDPDEEMLFILEMDT